MTERSIKSYVRKCVDREVSDRLKEIRDELKLPPPQRKFLTLREAVEFKGGNYNTIKDRPNRQPKGGRPDMLLFGKKVWKASTIMQWSQVGDHNQSDYLKACELGRNSQVKFS